MYIYSFLSSFSTRNIGDSAPVRNKEPNILTIQEPTALANNWRTVGLRCLVGLSLTLHPTAMPRCTILAMAHYERRNKSNASECNPTAQR